MYDYKLKSFCDRLGARGDRPRRERRDRARGDCGWFGCSRRSPLAQRPDHRSQRRIGAELLTVAAAPPAAAHRPHLRQGHRVRLRPRPTCSSSILYEYNQKMEKCLQYEYCTSTVRLLYARMFRINYIPWADAQVYRDTQLLVLQSQRQARASNSAQSRLSPRYV